eukprot:9473706-Pyramimonas_sp.AAC.1
MKEESVEREPAEMQVSSGAASSRDGPRGAAGGAQDSLGAPAAPGPKRPVQALGELVRAHIRRGHVPFEARCQERMMGRGQEDPHRARDPNASATP